MSSTNRLKHLAIIMDRNGEWAKRRMLSRMKGHMEGMQAVKRVIKLSVKYDIEVLSLFAFSTENWLRPQDEVSFLMKLLEEFITIEGESLVKAGVRLVISGRLDRLPTSTRVAVEGVISKTAHNSKLVLNIALDYGGQDEIVAAATKLAQKVQAGLIKSDEITREDFCQCLYHPDLPDVDLMVRTGGEERVSNFMLWQIAYAELYFTPLYWPDFDEKAFLEAMESFKQRKRRFGKTDEQLGQ